MDATNREQTRMPKWRQKTVKVKAKSRGCHLVTDEIVRDIREELRQYSVGLAHFFIKHTSASLTLNENYDSDVQKDMEDALNRLAPESGVRYRHTMEGKDDMPAHIKASLFGSSVSIPITDGQLNLGTWQGIWLCEHRDRGGSRSIVVTLQGI